MADQFVTLTDLKQFEEFTSKSNGEPVVIFKHSLTCPISAAAYEQMSRYAGAVGLIEIQRARGLSSEIERRLGVAHESPQVIVVQNGQVVWNASHFKVTADAVAEAVKSANG
jgi:bacillithiol system protein YtxJ